jgi:5-methylcytosine-specific restriction endonuclease McrBC regulatory subunit McrC
MNDLKNFSEEQLVSLAKECNRLLKLKKEFKNNIPQPLEKPNFDELIELCNYILKEIYEHKYNKDDNQYYIYETALEVIYGEKVFKWIEEMS